MFSAIDRLVTRGTNVITRLAHKHHPQTANDTIDDSNSHRPLKKVDSNEYLAGKRIFENETLLISLLLTCLDRLPKASESVTREPRLLTTAMTKGPAPLSPKPSITTRRKSPLKSANEDESISTPVDTVYNNFRRIGGSKKDQTTLDDDDDDEGDLIEHDLLNLVEQEQKKDQQRTRTTTTTPALPAKHRVIPAVPDNSLEIDIEPITKLIHPGSDDLHRYCSRLLIDE
jgi:hypothetical protein